MKRFELNGPMGFSWSFLSDPSPIIGYACHSLTHSLTHWITHSVTFSRLDGCEKVFQVGEKNRVTFLKLIKAVKLSKGGKCTIWSWHVSPPTHVTECGKFWFLLLLLNWIWKIPSPDKCLFFGGKFNKKKAELLFRLWAQDLVKFLKLRLRQDLKLEFGQYFEI